MTDKELRALDLRIATEIMGTICLCEKDKNGWSIHGYGSAGGICYRCSNPHDPHYYSTDISSAFDVVGKFDADYNWKLYNEGTGEKVFVIYKDATHYEGVSDTVPLAICLSALKAVEVKPL